MDNLTGNNPTAKKFKEKFINKCEETEQLKTTNSQLCTQISSINSHLIAEQKVNAAYKDQISENRRTQIQINLVLTATKKELEDTKSENFSIREVMKLIRIEIQSHKRSESCEYTKISITSTKLYEENVNLRNDLKNLEKKHEEFTKKEEKIKMRIYSGDEKTPYFNGTVVDEVIEFMKEKFKTSKDYHDLILNVLKKSTAENHGFILTPEQTAIIKSTLSLSDNALKTMKSLFKDWLGFDVFCSREKVSEWRKQFDRSGNYKITQVLHTKINENGHSLTTRRPKIIVKDLRRETCARLQQMELSGNLEKTDEIGLVFTGDKGDAETKLCIAFHDISRPNNPDSLLVVAIYPGQDNEDGLKKNALDVIRQWNELTDVTFLTQTGTTVTKKVRKTVVGDLNFQCALLGHAGLGCLFSCIICFAKWSSRGKNMLLLENADFSQKAEDRTLASYVENGKTGTGGVRKGSGPLLNLELSSYCCPGLHIFMGVFDKYPYEFMVGEANRIDFEAEMSLLNTSTAKIESIATTFKAQKKELEQLKKQEDDYTQYVEEVIKAQKDAECSAKHLEDIMKDPHCHRKAPEPLCKSAYCIINHFEEARSSDTWAQCGQCKEYCHYSCSSIFTLEKMKEVEVSNWTCDNCLKMSLLQRRESALNDVKLMTSTIQWANVELDKIKKRRETLENLLLRSTGPKRRELESLLVQFGCDNRGWYQSHTGGQIRNFLRDENINAVMDIFPNNERNDAVRSVMLQMADLMTISGKATYTDAQIDHIEALIEEFMQLMKKAFPKETVIPKLHALAHHVVPYLRIHKTWGKVSEQGIESFHARYNGLKRRFQTTKNVLQQGHLIMGEITVRNYLADRGLFN